MTEPSTSSISDQDEYLLEFDCEKCGQLMYKEKNDIRNVCVACKSKQLKVRRERKRKMKEAIEVMKDKRIALQCQKYGKND